MSVRMLRNQRQPGQQMGQWKRNREQAHSYI